MERRRRAADLFAQGANQAEVARRLGVSRVTAMHWHRVWRARGRAGLLRPARRGRRPKLGPDQMRRIDEALLRPPRAWGYPVERWSLAAVAALIEKLAGVSYHHRHVGRLLRRMGWIVPPIGRRETLRARFLRDCDGNRIALLERRG